MKRKYHVTLDLREAAAFFHMSPSALREKAKRGLIRGAKPAKRWVFLEADLVAYLRPLYPASGQAPSSGLVKENALCHITNAAISGGSESPPQQDSEYAARLGLMIGNRPKSTTTPSR